MRIIVQRVKSASVIINTERSSSIQNGLLCYVGFCDLDTDVDFEWAINKLLNLNLFNHKRSLLDINGEVLIVSQFTLFGSVKKGNNPSWMKASKPKVAIKLYQRFVALFLAKFPKNIKTGFFGENMDVLSVNDGPFTLFLDTKQKE